MRRYIAGFIVGAVLFGGVALATIPDGSGVIHGCYKNSTGALRVIDDATQTCTGPETAITWSQTGPQGPAGSDGLYGRGFSTFQMEYQSGSGTMTVPSDGNFSLATSPNSQYVGSCDCWPEVTEVWLADFDVEGYNENIFTTEQASRGGTALLSITLDPDHYVLFRVTETIVLGQGTELRVQYVSHVGHVDFSNGAAATFEMIPD